MPMSEHNLREANALLSREGFVWRNQGRSGPNWKKRIYAHEKSGLELVLVDNAGFCFLLEREIQSTDGVKRGQPLRGGSLDGSKIGPGGGYRYDAISLSSFSRAVREYLTDRASGVASEAAPMPGSLMPTLEGSIDEFENEVKTAQGRTSAERQKRISDAPKIPSFRTVSIVVYSRNPDVVAEALNRANGACESCSRPAPFSRRSDGSPYLEVHHKVRLADGGEDTLENAIALCPNCHRFSHFG